MGCREPGEPLVAEAAVALIRAPRHRQGPAGGRCGQASGGRLAEADLPRAASGRPAGPPLLPTRAPVPEGEEVSTVALLRATPTRKSGGEEASAGFQQEPHPWPRKTPSSRLAAGQGECRARNSKVWLPEAQVTEAWSKDQGK